jgi:hypothetical protein
MKVMKRARIQTYSCYRWRGINEPGGIKQVRAEGQRKKRKLHSHYGLTSTSVRFYYNPHRKSPLSGASYDFQIGQMISYRNQ